MKKPDYYKGTLLYYPRFKTERNGFSNRILNSRNRMVLWDFASKNKASIAFVNDVIIEPGETKEIEFVFLSSESIPHPIAPGDIYLAGTPSMTIAEIKVTEVLGLYSIVYPSDE